jgi:hypothetical protein
MSYQINQWGFLVWVPEPIKIPPYVVARKSVAAGVVSDLSNDIYPKVSPDTRISLLEGGTRTVNPQNWRYTAATKDFDVVPINGDLAYTGGVNQWPIQSPIVGPPDNKWTELPVMFGIGSQTPANDELLEFNEDDVIVGMTLLATDLLGVRAIVSYTKCRIADIHDTTKRVTVSRVGKAGVGYAGNVNALATGTRFDWSAAPGNALCAIQVHTHIEAYLDTGGLAGGGSIVGGRNMATHIGSIRFGEAPVGVPQFTAKMSGWFPHSGADAGWNVTYYDNPRFITGFSGEFGETSYLRQFTSIEYSGLSALYAADPVACCTGTSYANNSPNDKACRAFGAVPGTQTCAVLFTDHCKKNLPDPRCMTYCQSGGPGGARVNCDAIGQAYAASLGDKVGESEEAACFRTPQFYANFFDSLQQQVNLPVSMPRLPSCYYPKCATSRYRPYNDAQCPNVQNCITNVNADLYGTVNGSVTIAQNNQCNMTSKSCVGVSCGANGTCRDGACVCTNGWTGANCNTAPTAPPASSPPASSPPASSPPPVSSKPPTTPPATPPKLVPDPAAIAKRQKQVLLLVVLLLIIVVAIAMLSSGKSPKEKIGGSAGASKGLATNYYGELLAAS